MIFLKYCRVKEQDLHSLTTVEGEAAGLEALQEDDNSAWFSYITFCCARKFNRAWIFYGIIAYSSGYYRTNFSGQKVFQLVGVHE